MRGPLLVLTAGLFLVAGPGPVAADHGPSEARFVVGTNLIGFNFMSCQGWTGIEEWGVNGACKLSVPRLPLATILVRDLFNDPVGFQWYGSTTHVVGFGCGASGHAFGQVSVELHGCDHLTIAPDAGAVAGWIRVV